MKNFLATAVLTLGTTAMIAAPAMADWRHDHRYYPPTRYERSDRWGRDFDYNISLREVPRRVLDTLADVSRGRPVESIQYVRRDGRTFYRFRVDRRHDTDLSFRISPDGRVLSVQEAGW